MIIQSIQSCFSWKIVSLLDPSKLILQNQACKFNPILLKLKIRSSSRSWQVDPVRLILANRSCKILSSFRTTVSILQKRSNVIIHVAIYNFWGLFLPNPSNQNWWRKFNNYRIFISVRIALFTKFLQTRCTWRLNGWALNKLEWVFLPQKFF